MVGTTDALAPLLDLTLTEEGSGPLISADELRSRLAHAFPDAELEVTDLTGTQDHYQARVVTAAFEGKSPIEQHQLVYRALAEAMDGPIHALSLQTYTPQVWNTLNRGSL